MKKINKILIIAFAFFTIASISSCKKYLDINTDPTTATAVDGKLLFGYAVTYWDENRCAGDIHIPISLMSQSIASGGNYGWGADNLYVISPTSLNNTWTFYYQRIGNNLQLAINAFQAAGNKNAVAQCQVVLAEVVYEASLMFGDVPYSEAWTSTVPYPKFDAQKDVFESLLKLLNGAISSLDAADPLKISDYDIYYAGDIAKWKKLATSIKFKILMTMVDKDPTKAAEIGTLVANPSSMINAAAENWLFKYLPNTTNANPKQRLLVAFAGGANIFFFANKNVLDYMKPTDPRLPRYFDKPASAPGYIGVQSEEEADGNTATISAYLYRQDAPDLLCTYQELSLLQSEAYARGLGVTKDLAKAQTLYNQGLLAAMTFYGANAAATTTYIATQVPDLTTIADPVKEIHLQQWIDLMDRPIEAFTQWRRSGPDGSEVPALTVPVGATAGPLIRRYIYSQNESQANPNLPKPTPVYSDKQWFDL
jgi:hypothetical protein